jgi:hypothetical protein
MDTATPSASIYLNARRYLKYLSFHTMKHFKTHTPQELIQKIDDLERRNKMLQHQMAVMENELKKNVFVQGTGAGEVSKQIASKKMRQDYIKTVPQVFPQNFFEAKQQRINELESKIEAKVGPRTETLEYQRLARLDKEKKIKRAEEIEKKMEAKEKEKILGPFRAKLTELRKEYYRIKRLKRYKNKQAKLKRIKVTIDRISQIMEDY